MLTSSLRGIPSQWFCSRHLSGVFHPGCWNGYSGPMVGDKWYYNGIDTHFSHKVCVCRNDKTLVWIVFFCVLHKSCCSQHKFWNWKSHNSTTIFFCFPKAPRQGEILSPGLQKINHLPVTRLYSPAFWHSQPMYPPVYFLGNLMPSIINSNPRKSTRDEPSLNWNFEMLVCTDLRVFFPSCFFLRLLKCRCSFTTSKSLCLSWWQPFRAVPLTKFSS